MEPLVLLVVLAAALLHAAWNAIAKTGGDPLTRVAMMAGFSALCGVPLLFWLPPPDPASWPMLATSVAVHQVYFAFLILAYRAGDLSTVYPIARGVAPPLVAVGALMVAGESLHGWGIAAVLLIAGGVASLAFGEGWRAGQGRAVLYALCTALTIAVYSVADGLGGRVAGNVISYVAYLFVLEGVPLTLFAIVRKRGQLRGVLVEHGKSGAVAGVLAFVAYGLVIWAMSSTPMSYVSALREVSVVFAAFIGTRLLGEKSGARRVAAAVSVALGIAVLQLSQ